MNEFREEVSYMLDQGFSAREIAVISGMHEEVRLWQEINKRKSEDECAGE